jgi:hypothetical protein
MPTENATYDAPFFGVHLIPNQAESTNPLIFVLVPADQDGERALADLPAGDRTLMVTLPGGEVEKGIGLEDGFVELVKQQTGCEVKKTGTMVGPLEKIDLDLVPPHQLAFGRRLYLHGRPQVSAEFSTWRQVTFAALAGQVGVRFLDGADGAMLKIARTVVEQMLAARTAHPASAPTTPQNNPAPAISAVSS